MNESHDDHTLVDIFERLIEIEYKSSKLYTELSKLCSHLLDISDFLRKLAKDEIFHIEYIARDLQIVDRGTAFLLFCRNSYRGISG
jgi:ferritin